MPLELDQLKVSATVLLAASRDVAMYEVVSAPEVIGVEPDTVTVLIAPGLIVTTLPPDLVGAEIEVAVIVTVPDKTPVSLSMLRVAEPVPLELDQLKVSVTELPTASRETAVYEADSMPEVIGVEPETVTFATAPGTTVNVCCRIYRNRVMWR